MASSSSSHQQNQRFNPFSGIEPAGKRRKVSESSTLFDVFINHRGPDVKHGLATQLYKSLKEVGIRAFLDLEEKELGESFPSTIETAIKSAKVHIAIFSKRYAESPWCLAELVLMSQTKAKIIPVFYQVKPSDLRFIEKGEYAKYFTEFENKRRYLEKLPEWKEALQSLSFVAGEEFNGNCKNIIAAVQKEIQKKTCLHVATYPVGLDNLVQDFQKRCLNEVVLDFENECGLKEGKCKSKVVGVFGMGGCGKTTLAKELFNRKSSNYHRASFLFDVREASVTGRLTSLQSKLLRDLFQNNSLSPTSTDEGKSFLEDNLRRSPNESIFIVVDDIDHVEQLNALMIGDILNKFCNSLVIVTTRDVGLLVRAGINDGYNLKGMDRNNGRELFCWHAFNQPHSSNGYERLVNDFVDVCGGLPLSLQVLGRHVHGKPEDFWRSALKQARKTIPQDVKHRLKISFDSLSREEKQIFMDIACFFIGKTKDIAERVWKGSGWNAQHSLEMLKDKCLVEETDKELRMHDHIRDLGREMALELNTPLRLWRPQDLQYLESMGLENILAKNNLRCFHSMFDESMSCKVAFFLGQPDICVETLAFVLWLELSGIECERIPSWISLRYVQCLKIQHGRLKTLWENRVQAPSRLKELEIGFCSELEELSLGHLSCLERISITECSQLESVSGINDLAELVELEISYCGKLEIECLRLTGMRRLETIIFDRNVKVKHFEVDNCQNLKTIKYGCQKIARFEESLIFVDPICLVGIIINECGKFKYLGLINCENLKTVSGNLEIGEVQVTKCPELEELPKFSSLSCMEKISIASCRKLKLQNIILPTSLTSLSLKNCSDLQRVSTTGDLTMLTKFRIEECPELVELPIFSSLICMEYIKIESCGKLQDIMLPTCLIRLHVESCLDLQKVSTTGDLTMLTKLYIKDCPELMELPKFSSPSCLLYINIESCGKLQNIMKRISIASCGKLKNTVLPRRLFLKQIVIDSSQKLQNISGIKELYVETYMSLCYCSNAVIRNCIDKLKNVPWLSVVIGRAVEGAESSLNKYLFSDAETVTDIVRFDAENFEARKGLLSIICCVVVVDSSTSSEDINKDLSSWSLRFPIRLSQGEWIITITGHMRMREISGILKRHGIMNKGFQVGVRKDEERKTRQILHKIVDRLHHS